MLQTPGSQVGLDPELALVHGSVAKVKKLFELAFAEPEVEKDDR